MNKNYYELPNFENIFLEDSYVLDLLITPVKLTIDLEVVLTENHFLYRKPLPSEQYCCRKAKITFLNVEFVSWKEKIKQPYKDALGEIDYGNIDSFIFVDNTYKISGDIGELEIISDVPSLEIY